MGKPLMAVDAAPAVNQPAVTSLPTAGNVEVRKYDPKQKKPGLDPQQVPNPAAEEYLVSPITGERVPASKVQEHMRIGLLDPRWVEERDKQITAKASEDAVYAGGRSIESNLRSLAERRTDIFGVGEEAAQETAIGKKMGEEEKRASDTGWDGYTASAESAAKAARANVTMNDQIEHMQRTKSMMEAKEAIGPKPTGPSSVPAPVTTTTVPAPPPPVHNVVSMIPAPPVPVMAPPPQPQFYAVTGFQQPAMAPVPVMVPTPVQPVAILPPAAPAAPPPPPPSMDEPPSKKSRGEDHLIPEGDFMAHYPGSVTFSVVCPNVPNEKAEWKLHGQTVHMTFQVADPVSQIKARLVEETGMPVGKQKLQIDSLFLKDVNSLAYYNIRPGTVVALQVKERGGRKK